MADPPDLEFWSTEQVKACFVAAAAASEQGRPIYKLSPALQQILNTVEACEVSGETLKYIDKNFIENEAGITKWTDQTAWLAFTAELVKRPARTLDRIGFEPSFPPVVATDPSIEDADREEIESTARQLDSGPAPLAADALQQLPDNSVDTHDSSNPPLESAKVTSKQPRRVTVQTIAPLKSSQPQHHHQQHAGSYMPSSKLDFDRVFFGETAIGSQVMLEDSKDENFQSHTSLASPAVTHALNTRFKFFLGKPLEIDIRNAPSHSVTIAPYKLSLKSRPSATVFKPQGSSKFRPYRALVRTTADGLHAIFNDEPEDEYSDLLRRYPDQFGDDEDAVSVGDVSPTMEITTETSSASDGDSMAEEGPEELGLDITAIEAVMDDAVASFESSWEAKLPKLERARARVIWRKMKSSRLIRDHLIASASKTLDHLNSRLSSYRKELVRADFKDVDEARRSCEVMQPTVEQIKQKHWEIDVWHRRQEPAGEDASSKPRSRNLHSRPLMNGTSSIADTLLAHLGVDDRLTPSSPVSPQQSAHDAETSADMAPNDEDVDHKKMSQTQAELLDDTSIKDFLVNDNQRPRGLNSADAFNDDKAEPEAGRDAQPDAYVRMKSHNRAPSITSVISISDDSSVPQSRRSGNAMTPLKTPKSSSRLEEMSAIVDAYSSDDEPVPPPKRLKVEKSSHNDPQLRAQRHQSASRKEVTQMTARDVDDLDMSQLVFDRDHRKLLLKLLSNQDPEFRQQLSKACFEKADSLSRYMLAALEDVVHGTDQSQRLRDLDLDAEMEGVLHRCARIAIAWWSSDIQVMDRGYGDWTWCQEFLDDPEQVLLFCDELTALLAPKAERLFAKAPLTSRANPQIIDSSASDYDVDGADPDDMLTSARKPKRRRKAKASREAHEARQAAKDRQDRFRTMKLSQSDSTKLARMLGDDHENVKLEINPSRDADEAAILVDASIAKQLKPHQIEGIQFLWREMTAREEHGVRGCLLAHDMGLGKTMQSITTMLTILEASQSDDRDIRHQLPKHLRPRDVHQGNRSLRMLVLCPPALIINWTTEIHQWAGHGLGEVFSVNDMPSGQRLEVIKQWNEDGGVLLLGYQLFVGLYNAKDSITKSAALEILQRSTELVVADEAHHFKNTRSITHKAVTSLSAKSRLAMSGTPMSNDIDEIFSLISWISPGYLGDQDYFRARFANPIKDGLFADSTQDERRKSQIKLTVLRAIIDPKYLRADVTVLKGAMLPKTEYILTVAPTRLQTETYKRFTTVLKGEIEDAQTSQVQFFALLNALTLLLNHPWSFRRRLLEDRKPNRAAKRPADEDTADAVSDPPNAVPSASTAKASGADADKTLADLLDEENDVQGLSKEMRLEILQGIDDSVDEQLSAKTALFTDILTRSLAAGDKVLVFSNRLHTLDYLSALLSKKKIRFGRIDGTTAIPERTKIIGALGGDRINVLLISTKAGGVGLNMQKANRVVIFDSGFNPMHEQQAVGRAYRIGQEKPVFVYRFVSGGTFEINMENRQLFKTSLAQRVVDKKQPLRNAFRNVSKWLYDPRSVAEEDISGWLGKDPGVLDEIIEAQLSQRKDACQHKIFAIKTMETLQADAKDPELDEAGKRSVDEEVAEGRVMRLRSRVVTQGAAGPSDSPNVSLRSAGPGTETAGASLATPPHLASSLLPSQTSTPRMDPVVPQPSRFGMFGSASRLFGSMRGQSPLQARQQGLDQV